MYEVKINGKKYNNVPESIDDISIGRFLKLRSLDADNMLDTIHWAIDEKVNFIHTDDVENELSGLFSLIQPVINQVYDFIQSQDQINIPSSINVSGLEIKLYKGLLNSLPYFPYVIAKKLLIDEFNKPENEQDPTSHIGTIVAHYLYSEITKEVYNEAKADKFATEMIEDPKLFPMKQTIQLGNFFLLKHIDLFPLNKRSSLRKLNKIISKRVSTFSTSTEI